MRTYAIACLCRLHVMASQRHGASAIEYALLASLIAVVIVSAVTAVGANLGTNFYNRIANAMT